MDRGLRPRNRPCPSRCRRVARRRYNAPGISVASAGTTRTIPDLAVNKTIDPSESPLPSPVRAIGESKVLATVALFSEIDTLGRQSFATPI